MTAQSNPDAYQHLLGLQRALAPPEPAWAEQLGPAPASEGPAPEGLSAPAPSGGPSVFDLFPDLGGAVGAARDFVSGARERLLSAAESLPWWSQDPQTEAASEPQAHLEAPEHEALQAPQLGDQEPEAPAEEDDGFDAVAVRKAMDEIFKDYTEMTITVPYGPELDQTMEVSVTAKYRNFGSNEDWLGAKSASPQAWNFKEMLKEGRGTDEIVHSEAFAQAYAGKATPKQLQEAILEAAHSGELRTKLQEIESPEKDNDELKKEVKAVVEGFAHHKLGLDCVGFAWRVIDHTGQFKDFTPLYDLRGGRVPAKTIEEKLEQLACRGMMDGATDITSNPDSWRTMDVIIDPSHVILIYDVEKMDGEARKTKDEVRGPFVLASCMESSWSKGVWDSYYAYNLEEKTPAAHRWQNAGDTAPHPKSYYNPAARVMRLKNNDTVTAHLDSQKSE